LETKGLLISIVLCSVVTMLGAPQTKKIKLLSATPTASINGADLFREYCAVCHGQDARGGGPAAEALKKAPADLTQISRRNGGQFPEIRVQQFIKGDDVIAAHGSRDMPTWGSIFRQLQPDSAIGELRVRGLLEFLKQIQAK
jgi:mono/diheme cytochrome c family protein